MKAPASQGQTLASTKCGCPISFESSRSVSERFHPSVATPKPNIQPAILKMD